MIFSSPPAHENTQYFQILASHPKKSAANAEKLRHLTTGIGTSLIEQADIPFPGRPDAP
jgi:hypothetical protein